MGHARGKPVVVITLNGSTVIPKNTGGLLEKLLFPVLLHELTHVADKYKGRGPAKDMSRDEARGSAAYYNDPGEVRAYMQEVVDELEDFARHLPKFQKTFGISKGVDVLLKRSATWNEISPHWTEDNKRKVIKAVIQMVNERQEGMAVTAGLEVFGERDIEKLRKDFLILMKNVPKVVAAFQNNDLEVYEEFRGVVKRYRKTFYTLMFDNLLNRLDKGTDVSDEDVASIKRILAKPAWDLKHELDTFPGDASSFRAIEAWDKRTRRKGQDFWKAAKMVFSWYESMRKKYLMVRVPDRLVLEGFQTDVVGYKEDEYDPEYMARTKEALKQYRSKAKARMPWLIQNQLPLVLDFEGGLDKGGEYRRSDIWVNATTGRQTEEMVRIFAHEMGHHRYKTIGGNAEKFWVSAIKQDYGPLDIQKALDAWPASSKSTWGAVDYLKDKDPVLALQLDILSYGHGGDKAYDDREAFETALATAQTLNVPRSPVTGYGGKNPEEAFCEAIGMLVAYGPRAVHEQIRHWLEVILPGEVKMASSLAARVANRYLQAMDDPRVRAVSWPGY
jgi:hypothetical protein